MSAYWIACRNRRPMPGHWNTVSVMMANAINPPICRPMMVMTGGRIRRIVVPNAQITDRSGEITYVDGEAVTYPAVFVAYPDANGDTHKEYIATAASS